ncbi:hypothetical protein BH11GEM1_BH11GEM1_32890 [soil metagenome]
MLCDTTTGKCVVFDGACNGGGSTIWIVCFTLGPIAFTKDTDHILSKGGQAWLIQGSKQTAFASDELQSSMARLNARYPNARSANPRAKREGDRVWEAFFRSMFSKGDTGTVSGDRLLAIQKETGLAIREARKGASPGRLERSRT